MARSMYAMVQFISQSIPQEGAVSDQEDAAEGFTPEMLEQVSGMLAAVPDASLEPAIAAAAVAMDSITEQTAAVFVKSFYQQLGADTGAIQTRYILRTGGKMLLMAAALMICAIGVGFCASRAGAGMARNLRRDIFRKVSDFTNTEFDRF